MFKPCLGTCRKAFRSRRWLLKAEPTRLIVATSEKKRRVGIPGRGATMGKGKEVRRNKPLGWSDEYKAEGTWLDLKLNRGPSCDGWCGSVD